MAEFNYLSKFIGQDRLKQGIITLITSSTKTGNALHHLLLCADPGMGKTTLAKIIAAELGVQIRITSGPSIERTGDLAAILTNLGKHDVLFIDEIHRINKAVEDVLYPAMEDSILDLMIGKGQGARSLRLDLPPFTVIGTTSNPLQVNKELSDLMFELDFDRYEFDEISRIIISYAMHQQIDISLDAADLITKYSNECPADSLKVLKKVYEYAIVHSDGHITDLVAKDAIDIFKIKANSSMTGRELIPADVMMFVWQRDKGRCVKCGGQEKLEYDHIIPISKGGSNTERNIQLLCEHCNRSKGANIA